MGLTNRSFELEVNRVNFNSNTRLFIPSTLTFFIKEKLTVNGDVITPQRFTHSSSSPLILTREGDVQLIVIQSLKMDLCFSPKLLGHTDGPIVVVSPGFNNQRIINKSSSILNIQASIEWMKGLSRDFGVNSKVLNIKFKDKNDSSIYRALLGISGQIKEHFNVYCNEEILLY